MQTNGIIAADHGAKNRKTIDHAPLEIITIIFLIYNNTLYMFCNQDDHYILIRKHINRKTIEYLVDKIFTKISFINGTLWNFMEFNGT